MATVYHIPKIRSCDILTQDFVYSVLKSSQWFSHQAGESKSACVFRKHINQIDLLERPHRVVFLLVKQVICLNAFKLTCYKSIRIVKGCWERCLIHNWNRYAEFFS
jgi:hypothetical protein